MSAVSTGAALWLVAVSALALVLAAVVTTAEAALTRLTRSEAADLVTEGRPGARTLQPLVADASLAISATTLVRSAARAVMTVALAVALASLVDPWWLGLLLALLLVAAADFIGLGVAPRTLGRQHAASVALRLAGTLTGLTTTVGLPARALVAVGNALTPGEGYRDGPFSSESELREMVDRASESDLIEAGERRMIHSVFELGDTVVREVMSPRTDMVTVPLATPPRVALRTFLTSGLSRLPVVGDSVDDVRGILFLKDLVRQTSERRPASVPPGVGHLLRPATFVPESKGVDSLLREMQQQSVHLAIVVDEYGGVAGLVTLEDALEEIVGEIADEYDRAEPEVVVVDAGTFRVSPRMAADDLGELFGLDVDDDEVDSVGGLLAKALSAVPAQGDTARVAGLVLVAEHVEGNRLTAVLASAAEEEGDHDGGGDVGEVAAARGSHTERERREEHEPRAENHERHRSEQAHAAGGRR